MLKIRETVKCIENEVKIAEYLKQENEGRIIMEVEEMPPKDSRDYKRRRRKMEQ